MASASKKQNLDLFYNMFTTEYETSIRNIEICKEKADHIYDLVQRQWDSTSNIQSCLENYDKALTDLSQLADKLRKFNIQLELESLQMTKDSKEERFTYPQPKLLQYNIGHESECVITYIKDAKNKLFYITQIGEESLSQQIIKMQTYFHDNPREFDTLPKDGEVFGLHLEGYMFRAVKENGNSDKFSNFKAYLIDVGEVVTINECMPMYVLPVDYQELSAQAVLCKLEKVNNNNDINGTEYLGKSLYVQHKFRIMDKNRSMLFVNIYGNTNPFRGETLGGKNNIVKNEKPIQQIINPFKRYLCIKTEIDRSQIDFSDVNNRKDYVSNVPIENRVEINEYSVFNGTRNGNRDTEYQGKLVNSTASNGPMNDHDYNKNNELVKKVNFNNDFDLNYLSKVLNDTLQSRNSTSDMGLNCVNRLNCNSDSDRRPNSVNTSNALTDEQRRVLYEEPLNTTNAMKAVMGYDPKDDKRICSFYNPLTKSCFKGARCKMEHVEKIKEGWTRDEASTVVDIANQIVYPKVGEYIAIIPTHIINVENFFGQIAQQHMRYEPTLTELIYKMNSPEIVQTYRILKSMPVLFELVIAKYFDGCWYRAKILNVMDDDTVKVFYMDYGNSYIISIDDVRIWEKRFEYIPFQAVRCKIAGIAEKRSRSIDAAEQLRKMILNQTLKAQVINNIEYLDLQVWDVYNNDVAEELISLKYVDRKELQIVRPNQLLPA